MAIVKFKTDEAEGRYEKKPIPPGTYRCRVLTTELKVSKNGTNYISWKMEIESLNPDINRRWVYHSTPVEGKGFGLFKRMIEACGLNTSELPHASDGSLMVDTSRLHDATVMATLEPAFMSDGSESNFPNVTSIEPDNASTREKADKDSLPF